MTAGRSQPTAADGQTPLKRSQSISQEAAAPPALPAKSLNTSQLSLPNKNSYPTTMSSMFTSQSNSHLQSGNNSLTRAGGVGMDRAGSIQSQPPMHLNYPPKPQQMLNSLQQSNNIFPNNNGIGRTSMQKPNLAFANNSNQNRMNPSGYPNNPNGGMNGLMVNRPLGHTSSGFIQPNVFGNNGESMLQSQHLMSSQMRPGHDQFQGHPDKLMGQVSSITLHATVVNSYTTSLYQ